MHSNSATFMQDQVRDRVYTIMTSKPGLPGEPSESHLPRSLWYPGILLGLYLLASTGASI